MDSSDPEIRSYLWSCHDGGWANPVAQENKNPNVDKWKVITSCPPCKSLVCSGQYTQNLWVHGVKSWLVTSFLAEIKRASLSSQSAPYSPLSTASQLNQLGFWGTTLRDDQEVMHSPKYPGSSSSCQGCLVESCRRVLGFASGSSCWSFHEFKIYKHKPVLKYALKGDRWRKHQDFITFPSDPSPLNYQLKFNATSAAAYLN